MTSCEGQQQGWVRLLGLFAAVRLAHLIKSIRDKQADSPFAGCVWWKVLSPSPME